MLLWRLSECMCIKHLEQRLSSTDQKNVKAIKKINLKKYFSQNVLSHDNASPNTNLRKVILKLLTLPLVKPTLSTLKRALWLSSKDLWWETHNGNSCVCFTGEEARVTLGPRRDTESSLWGAARCVCICSVSCHQSSGQRGILNEYSMVMMIS